ncbi:MAG: flippase [Bacillota bacterium]
MNKVANIAKNTSYLTLALIIQKIISFSYFILLARYLGFESLGQYYTAISFTTIFSILIDLGFANALTREVAKYSEKASEMLSSVLSMKFVLAAGTLLLALLVAFFAYDLRLVLLIAVSALSMVLDSFTATFFAVIRGFHNLKYESISSVIFQLIVFIAGYAVLRSGGPMTLLLGTLVLASAFNFIYSALILRTKLGVSLKPKWQAKIARQVFAISWPFALYNVFQRLFTYLDSLLLGFYSGFVQVGIYQIAFKIIFALQFLPMAFTASLYPAMSSYWLNNRDQLRISFERAINYLIIISLPIIFGVFSLAEEIVPLFKAGDEAVWPLRISIVALFFIFLNFPLGSLLNACDRQRRNTRNMGLAAIASILLNLLLIPRWQALGASMTVLASNCLMLILGAISARGLISYSPKKNLIVLVKSLGASMLMGVAAYYGGQRINVFLAVIAGAAVYFASLFALGGLRKADIISIASSFKRV